MASLSRALTSSLINRTYINAPASVPALRKLFSVSSASHNPPNHFLVHHEKENEPSAPAHFGSYAKKRYDGTLVSRTALNGELFLVKSHRVNLITCTQLGLISASGRFA